MRARQTCEWCNRSVVNFRRAKGGGYECQNERRCCAPRRQNQGLLTRLGLAALVETLERHGGCVKTAALAIGVARKNLHRYLKLHAPVEWAQLRARFPPVQRGGKPHKLTDAAEVRRRLERYEGSLKLAAESLGVHPKTFASAVRRLAPGAHPGRPRGATDEGRKQDPSLHPWRRQWARKEAA